MRYLPWVCVLVAVLSAATPSPPRRAQSTSSTALDRVIEQYRRGDAVAAVDEFASWDAKRVESAAASMEASRGAARSDPAEAQVRPIAALVMLCTRAALERNGFALSGRAAPAGRPNYYETAHRLVKILADRVGKHTPSGVRDADSIVIRSFCRDWFVLTTALWMSAWQCGKAADAADAGLAALGDDAQLLLAAGSVAEARGVHERTQLPGSCTAPWPMASMHGPFLTSKETLESAQVFLQRALALDNSLAEARLRLGRVFYWGDKSADAVRELERTIDDVPPVDREVIGYLAALFLGQVHEEARRDADAIRAYERAISLNPRGCVAHLALGHLLIVSGQLEDGWAQARAALVGRETDMGNPQSDPWATYRDAQLWRATRLEQEMDAWVRQ